MAKGKNAGSKGGMKALVFLLLAVVACGAVVIMVMQLIKGYQKRIQEAERPEDTVGAIIAARHLFQGVKITEEDLASVEIPAKYLPHGAFVSHEHVVGRVPRERVLVNEFIREERLADPEEGVGLNAIIPRGMRAISINISGGRAVSGFVNPSNIVDILVTIDPGDGSKSAQTHTVLQAVPVLAVNDRLKGNKVEKNKKKEKKVKPSVTLAVTPEEAEQVAHASQKGRVTLTLRNDLDRTFKALDGTDSRELYGVEERAPKKRTTTAPKQSGPRLQIFKGTKGTEYQYDQ